jgi:hypothetical protein
MNSNSQRMMNASRTAAAKGKKARETIFNYNRGLDINGLPLTYEHIFGLKFRFKPMTQSYMFDEDEEEQTELPQEYNIEFAKRKTRNATNGRQKQKLDIKIEIKTHNTKVCKKMKKIDQSYVDMCDEVVATATKCKPNKSEQRVKSMMMTNKRDRKTLIEL